MKLSFRNRVLATIALVCVVCTGAAVVVAYYAVTQMGRNDAVEKARSILSRLEVGREYIADMGIMRDLIDDTRQRYPDGNVPKERKETILKSVPIFASFRLGQTRAEASHYQFRIMSTSARNKENTANAGEVELLKRFDSDKSLKEVVAIDQEADVLRVVTPVRLSEQQGCLACHGAEATSPWANGKDVLGYTMENMKDGDLKGAFEVRASLAPVHAEANRAVTSIALWSLAITVLALGLGFLILRSPLKRLGVVIEGVTGSSQQVNSAAQQVSASSQAMAEGASEQAASLEESSSTLEEMASSTRLNAEHAKKAEALAGEARQFTSQGADAMTRMSQAINNIREASTKTANIIKTIDEIAFQTNLLALNAAVEAARAGDAGKGFAVVAEEVRNLAQRSAEAARSTNELIEDAQQRAAMGVQVSTEVEKALGQIQAAIQKVADLVRDVASASDEQARGASQINTAVSQMDKVTQANAASAEQSAAASEQLSSQAMELQRMVRELVAVVRGGSAAGLDGAGSALADERAGQRFLEHQVKKAGPPRDRRPANGAGNGGHQPSLRERIHLESKQKPEAPPKFAEELSDADFKDI